MAIRDFLPIAAVESPSDPRQLLLRQLIEEEGYECALASESWGGEAGLVFLPISKTAEMPYIDKTRTGGAIFCGSADEEFISEAEGKGIAVMPLLAYEPFVYENADITAEAAIGMLILDSPKSLKDMKVAVLGSGRIAMALLKKLKGLGCGEVVMAARNKGRLGLAKALGASVAPLPLKNTLQGCDAVLNTVPAIVASAEELAYMPNGAIAYELASKAGFDFSEAGRLGLNPKMASGLPGKISYKSAAALVWESAKKILGGV